MGTVKEKTREYYIQLNLGGFEKTERKAVIIPGFESIGLFLHKTDEVLPWKVSEVSTGCCIGKGITPKKAISEAVKALEFFGIKKVKAQIKSTVRKHGGAPQGE